MHISLDETDIQRIADAVFQRMKPFLPAETPEFLNIKQAAELLNVKISWLRQNRHYSNLPQPKKIGRHVRWEKKDLLKWMEVKNG